MNFLLYLSDYIIPFTIAYIIAYGLISHCNIFEEFSAGAKEGISIIISIIPTLIALMVSIGILRSCGLTEAITNVLNNHFPLPAFPSALFPLVLIKMFSSSAATSLLLDLYKQYGTDSYTGFLASVIMGCSETVFYTISIYSTAGNIKKTRYIVPGALFATLSGIIISVILTSALYT
ncbi:MAG: spore maturation protein [Lachnospiraceae bacterium]|nr:spore maturation protein [Lachnospiraceae bacterium]